MIFHYGLKRDDLTKREFLAGIQAEMVVKLDIISYTKKVIIIFVVHLLCLKILNIKV